MPVCVPLESEREPVYIYICVYVHTRRSPPGEVYSEEDCGCGRERESVGRPAQVNFQRGYKNNKYYFFTLRVMIHFVFYIKMHVIKH